MKKIKLTNDPLRVALVDDEDFEFLSQWNWQSRKSKNSDDYYVIRKVNKNQATILMHSVVANTPKGMLCDHINHNTLDNRKCNLRNVTHTQSIMNTKTRKDNILGIRGVYFDKGRGKYMARLHLGGKYLLRKRFDTLEEAISARNEAEQRHFGEYSYTNSMNRSDAVSK